MHAQHSTTDCPSRDAGSASLIDKKWASANIPLRGHVSIMGHKTSVGQPASPVVTQDPSFVGTESNDTAAAAMRRTLLDFRRQADILLLQDDVTPGAEEPALLTLTNLELVNLPLGPGLDLKSFTLDSLSSQLWCARLRICVRTQ